MKNLFLSLLFLFSSSVFAMEKPPIATVQGSGSYTIPAGKWARAVVTVWSGGSATINATQVMGSSSQSWSVLATSPLVTTTYPGAVGLLTSGNTGGSAAAFGSQTAYSNSGTSQDYYLRPGDILACTGNCRYHVEIYKL